MNQSQTQSQPATVMQSFWEKLLDPLDGIVEAIYSVLIVLTFTLAYRLAENNAALGSEAVAEVSNLLVAALGCAVAWGMIDGVMYIVTSMFKRNQEYRLFVTIRDATGQQAAHALLADELDSQLAPIMTASERALLYSSLYPKLKAADLKPITFDKHDLAGALGVAIIAVVAAMPVVLPLFFANLNPALAVRLSNLVAFGMLYGLGHRWGQYVGVAPWKVGLSLLLVGLVMVGIALLLGG